MSSSMVDFTALIVRRTGAMGLEPCRRRAAVISGTVVATVPGAALGTAGQGSVPLKHVRIHTKSELRPSDHGGAVSRLQLRK